MAPLAVKNENLHHATNHLILEKPQRYYPTLIHDKSSGNHWQLRSLISSPKQNIIYYPYGPNVCALNTKTRERTIVATLSFSPQCLTASEDFICCGGDKGDPNYATIPLCHKATSWPVTAQAGPDSRLPLNLDPIGRSTQSRSFSITASASPGDSPEYTTIRYLRLGKEIVNSITIWTPNDGMISKGTYSKPVAVVSINDCSVRILNLETSEVVDKLRLPDCVNRSVMSPDGGLLCHVCDDPFLYIHERKPKVDVSDDNCPSGQSYEWALACKIQLEGQKLADRSIWRGSFTACFSRSRKYLAVATQYGVISVFDTERGPDFGSLVKTFTTSRPGDEHGAVRAMEFSPGPFDLLAWTESSGRVGIADVRNLFLSRQLITLDPKLSTVEQYTITDTLSELLIDPRLRNFQTDSSSSSTPDFLGSDTERRLQRLMERHQSTGDLEVLAAHREARRQRDAANGMHEALTESVLPTRWGNMNSESDGQRTSMSSTNDDTNGRNERRISTAGLPATLRDFVNADRNQASIRSFINERNRENERRNQQQTESRRRESTLLAAVENELAQHERSLGAGTGRNTNDNASSLERLTISQARAQNEWTESDSLYGPRLGSDPPLERTTRLRIEFEENGRDFAHRLRQPWRPMDEISHIELIRNRAASTSRRIDPRATNGCCWSTDGRILYAAIEEGIFEFHVDTLARRKFPSIVLR